MCSTYPCNVLTDIYLQMFNSAGDSLDSSFVDQTTFKKPPQNFPTVMRLNSTNTPHQIRVTWNGVRVMAEEESVDGYRMRYWLSGAPVRTALDVDVGLKITGLLNNLQYDVRYNLRIFAYSRGGHGKLSNPMDQFMLVPRDRCQAGTIIGKYGTVKPKPLSFWLCFRGSWRQIYICMQQLSTFGLICSRGGRPCGGQVRNVISHLILHITCVLHYYHYLRLWKLFWSSFCNNTTCDLYFID